MAFFSREGCSFVHDGKAKRACDGHDRRYAEVYTLRKIYDEEFLEKMNSDDVCKFKKILYYYGVRIFGRLFV